MEYNCNFVEKADDIYYITNNLGKIFTIGENNTYDPEKFENNFKFL